MLLVFPAIYDDKAMYPKFEDDLNVIVTASHTHVAPDLVGLWGHYQNLDAIGTILI